ncbi:MAG: hypothetical protein EOP11_20900 [Proteobacteria bacterium]|nr:MAG: hypothetical protein EOP11_20900 [Pseudomonadota bacterium]
MPSALAGEYIGNGLFEGSLPKSGMMRGESARKILYRDAFETCAKEKAGFKITEETKDSAVFRCEGEVDQKLAQEVQKSRLVASDEPNTPAEAPADRQESISPEAPRAEAAPSAPLEISQDKTKYVNLMGGLLVGLSNSEGSNFTVGGRVGADVLAEKNVNLAIGILGGYSKDQATVGRVKAEAHFSYLLGEILARKAFRSGLYYGVRLGGCLTYAKLTSSLSFYEGTTVRFVWGPVIGYELPFGSNAKANIDVALMNVGGGTLDAGGASLEVQSSSVFNTQPSEAPSPRSKAPARAIGRSRRRMLHSQKIPDSLSSP